MALATAEAIRDRILTLIEAITPSSLSGDKFRRYRNEGNGNFAAWAERNATASFRRVQVREVGDDNPPDVSNTDFEAVYLTEELRIAYPQSHRYGAANALDRDDVMKLDWKDINFSVGMYGRANFSEENDCTPLPAVRLATERGDNVDFLVIKLTYRYNRDTGAPDTMPASSTSYGTGRPLIILAGQSQARGHGDTFYLDNQYDLTTPYKSISLNTQIGADAVSPITWSIFGTTPLEPYSTPGTPSMGYELTLGRALWDAGHAPFIGKFTVDASGLDAHWLPSVNFPTSPVGKNLFGQLCEYIDDRLTETGSTLAVLIWDQGGTDSIDSGPASRYQDNLRLFIDILRDRYGQFALVLTELNDGIPSGIAPYVDVVRAAQVAYAATDSDCYLVNTDDVPIGGAHVDSSVHFDAESSAAIGLKLADAIAPLIGRTTNATAPTFVGAAPADFGAGELVPTWNIDGGYEAGDIAILAVTGGQTSATHSLSDAQGFEEIATVDSLFTSLHQRLTLYWCRATSNSMASPTVADISDFQMAKIFIFRGCIASGNPVDVSATGANDTYGTGISLPGAMSLTDRCLVAMFRGAYCAAQSNAIPVAPASEDFPDVTLQVLSGTNLGSGNFQIMGLVTGEQRLAGAFSAVTLTATFSEINANITIALKPVAV